MVGIIDYGTGNLKSVENALLRVGAEYCVSAEPKFLRSCSHIILPGVGDAKWAMEQIKERNIQDLIYSFTQPVMGICLGMQLMCSHSEENDAQCLGIFNNRVVRLPDVDDSGARIKVPHIGWNSVYHNCDPLFENIKQDEYFYFVHSYCAEIDQNMAGKTFYGREFSSVLHKDNFMGCQFHPEKSGSAGEQLLRNFLKMR